MLQTMATEHKSPKGKSQPVEHHGVSARWECNVKMTPDVGCPQTSKEGHLRPQRIDPHGPHSARSEDQGPQLRTHAVVSSGLCCPKTMGGGVCFGRGWGSTRTEDARVETANVGWRVFILGQHDIRCQHTRLTSHVKSATSEVRQECQQSCFGKGRSGTGSDTATLACVQRHPLARGLRTAKETNPTRCDLLFFGMVV